MGNEANNTGYVHADNTINNLVVIDFETYHDKDYSLRKLSPGQYTEDPRFELLGAAVYSPLGAQAALDGKDRAFLRAEDRERGVFPFKNFCDKTDWDKTAILTHWRPYTEAVLHKLTTIQLSPSSSACVHPGKWFDTYGLAKAVHIPQRERALSLLKQRYGFGPSGNELVNLYGKHFVDLSTKEYERCAADALADVENIWRVYVCLQMEQG